MDSISWSDFEKIELRAGTVVEVKEFPEARRPALKLKIDFGDEIGIKQILVMRSASNKLVHRLLIIMPPRISWESR